MVKPRGKVTRSNEPSPGLNYFLDVDSLKIAAWCPDAEALQLPEQVHLILHIQDLENIYFHFVVRFKSPDTLRFLIEELAAYRRYVWPSAEPLDVGAQTKREKP